MKLTSDFRRTLIATLVLCALISISITPVSANGGIRVHKAGQFQDNSDKQQKDFEEDHNKRDVELIKFLIKQQTQRKSSAKFQQPPVLDSRFPNSYRAYSDYQKSQLQRHGHNNQSKKSDRSE